MDLNDIMTTFWFCLQKFFEFLKKLKILAFLIQHFAIGDIPSIEHNGERNSKLNVWISTFNIDSASCCATKENEVLRWFDKISPKEDLIVIGLQEVATLSFSTFVGLGLEKGRQWSKKIHRILNKHLSNIDNSSNSSYELVVAQQLVGISIIIFQKCHTETSGKFISNFDIKNVQIISTPFGLVNMIGNKGNVGVRMEINDSVFGFLTMHLPSGMGYRNDRTKKFHESLNEFFRLTNSSWEEMDCLFAIGDMNYRLAAPKISRSTLQSIAEEFVRMDNFENNLRRITRLCVDNDELTTERKNDDLLKLFQEKFMIYSGVNLTAPKLFLPTYKYERRHLSQFDCKKMRFPAWCDRILFHSKHRLLQLTEYDSIQHITISDHKPVFAKFTFSLINDQSHENDGEEFCTVDLLEMKCS
ncbi:hypothetical protein SNEBB_000631 [Seison nebaliae]|nr:hypothetical protein SNEBB_000631 [Seison nebaliae]